MKRIETELPGVCIIEPEVFEDLRGCFFETYHSEKFAALRIDAAFVQENQSLTRRGVLRGLHYQLAHPQAKLCRVVAGEVFDVAVDIRVGSETFGRWTGVVLSSINRRQIFIPRGFAHGFIVRSETAEFIYKCDDFYHPEDECGVLWSDPSLAIGWGCTAPQLAPRDANYPLLSSSSLERLPRYRRNIG
ncbi:dTDP-4-dehydrorhamnose 3,5-epimerase [Candidatus Binatus sp.]|uniref:dTDP-4-dehydrorhamnose 3,5-epimerase n=1 Tax=Candidatus Binatus sp. TaxID=2811406 RepID=UPI003BDB0C10